MSTIPPGPPSDSDDNFIGVDLVNIPSGFDLFPNGKYLMRVESIVRKAGKPGKSDSLLWFHKIVNGPEIDKQTGDFTSLSPDALWRLRDKLMAHQYQPGPNGFDRRELLGKMAWASTIHEFYCPTCNKTVKSDPCNNCGGKSREQMRIEGWEPAI